MIWTGKFRVVFKLISSVLTFTFLWQQISWAGPDTIDYALDKLNIEQTQAFSPAYVQNQTAIYQNLISQKQAIEDTVSTQYLSTGAYIEPVEQETLDLVGSRGGIAPTDAPTLESQSFGDAAANSELPPSESIFSVTTSNGDIIHYKNSAIDWIEMIDGTILRNIIVDSENSLIQADITYSDGTIGIIREAKITTITKPDGTIIYYYITGTDDGLIQSILYPDGTAETYTYVRNAADKLIETIVTDTEKECRYNDQNRLTKVQYNAGNNIGKVIEYESGILKKVKEANGTEYIFEVPAEPDENGEYIVKLKEITDANKNIFTVTNGDISAITFPWHGVDGHIYDYEFDTDTKQPKNGYVEFSNGTKMWVENGKITRKEEDSYGTWMVTHYVPSFEPNLGNATVIANLDDDPREDIVVDFGDQWGIFIKYNDTEWWKLHDLSAKSMTTGDFNGDGRDEVIIDFGPGIGIWIKYYSSDRWTGWEKLHDLSAKSIVTGDFNGDGKDEIIIDFGPQYGIYAKYYGGSMWDNWQYLHYLSADSMVTGDFNGDGKDDIIIDFGLGVGIYVKYYSADMWTNWEYIHSLSADLMTMGDFNGDGKDDIIINFGPGTGIWVKYYSGGMWANWEKIHDIQSESIATGDFDGDGRDEIIFDFKQEGIWIKKYGTDWNTTWQKIHSLSPKSINVGNVDGTGFDDVVIDFGAQYGIYTNYNNDPVSGWSQLHSLSPKSMFFERDASGRLIANVYNDTETPDFWVSLSLPGDMFDATGHLKLDYDFKDIPYFDTIKYDANRMVKEVIKPNGKIVMTLADGLPTGGLDDTLYKFDSAEFGNIIKNVIVERANVQMTYDPRTGELLSIKQKGEGGAEVSFNPYDPSSIIFKMFDGSILTTPPELENGQIKDGVFEKYDEIGRLISKTEYAGGILRYYRDERGNEYRYDENSNLIEFKKKMDNERSITYIYTAGIVTTAEVPEAERSNLNAEDPVIIKYESVGSDRRIIYLETRDNRYKKFDYTESRIMVTEGNIKIVDNQKVLMAERVKKYDNDKILRSVNAKDGTTTLYDYNADNTVSRITVIKDSISYIFENGTFVKSVSKDRLSTFYYDNGLIKTTEISPGVFKGYRYGITRQEILNLNGILDNTETVIASNSETLQLKSSQDPDNLLLLHLNGQSDSSIYAHTPDFNNGAAINTDDKKFGASSLSLDGVDDYTSIADSSDWDIASDWTVSLWVKEGRDSTFASNTAYVALASDDAYGTENNWSLGRDASTGKLFFLIREGNEGRLWVNGSVAIGDTDKWHHVSMVKVDREYGLYLDGKQIGYTSNAFLPTQYDRKNHTYRLHIGNGTTYGESYWKGRMDEIMITKGNPYQANPGSDPSVNPDLIEVPTIEEDNITYTDYGTFISDPIEIDAPMLDTISWDQIVPKNTNVKIQIRSGSTSIPDESWSNWSAMLTESSGSTISQGGAKYIQIMASLESNDKTLTPNITLNGPNGMKIEYRQIQDGEINKDEMSLVQVRVGDKVNYYDVRGENITDPDDYISIPNLAVNATTVAGMRDNANVLLGEPLDLNPMLPQSYLETSKALWVGKIRPEDLDNMGEDEATTVTYELTGDNNKKRIVHFAKKNGDESYYDYSNGTTLVEDIKDENGRPYSHKITTYDDKGLIQQVKILYDDETKNQTINYENGRKKNAIQNKDGAELLKYSYETLQGGHDATVITDYSYGLDRPLKKYYVDDQLVKTVDIDKVETDYKYFKDGRVSETIISRAGKQMEVYKYSYDDENKYTIIEDIAGVKKVYTGDNKLMYVEKDNKIYAYYYSAGQTGIKNDDIEKIKIYMDDLETLAKTSNLLRNTDLSDPTGTIEDKYSYTPGDNFAVEELAQYTAEDGSVIRYDKGMINEISKPDKIVIRDIVYDGDKVSEYKIVQPVEMGGAIYEIKNGYVYAKVNLDKSVVTYHSNGWTRSTVDAQGNKTEYIYDVPMILTGNDNGKTYYTHIEEVGDNSILKLDENTPERTESAPSLLLHLDGTNGATSTNDSSKNNYEIDFIDGAHLDTANKKIGESSLALDGSDDYLSLPDSEDWNFGSGDFTVDLWARYNTLSVTNQIFMEQSSSDGSSKMTFYWSPASGLTFVAWNSRAGIVSLSEGSAAAYKADTWYHFALVRKSDSWKIYRDGIRVASATINSPLPNYAGPFKIGVYTENDGSLGQYYNGNIDEFRVSKGMARWDSDFDPNNLPYEDRFWIHGDYTSNPIEVNAVEFKSIDWSAQTPPDTAVTIQIRTGNSENTEGGTWSGWSGQFADSQSLVGAVTAAKFIQYKVNLYSNSPAAAPSIDLNSVKIDFVSNLSEGNGEGLTHALAYGAKTYIYDGRERLSQIVDGNTKYSFTPEGKISAIDEGNSRVTTYVYDDKDRAKLSKITVKDSTGELQYNADRKLTAVIRPDENVRYDYYYNDESVTVKTTYILKQTSSEDFAQFEMDGVAVDDYEGVTHIRLARQISLDYGTGIDGVLTVKKGETRILEARPYDFESIYVEEGATLTVMPWNRTSGGQLVIRCQKEAIIDGVVTVDGKGYQQVEGYGIGDGPGGGKEGAYGQDDSNDQPSIRGSGGGGAGHAASGESGANNSNTTGGAGGSLYSSNDLADPKMGSGGGNGGIFNAAGKIDSGKGGAGGGIIRIVAPVININGSLSANGTDGESVNNNNVGAGGGGSGGSIILSGEQVSLVGTITAHGGYGGSGVASGGDGSAGRIRVDYGIMEGDIYRGGDSNIYKASIYKNQLTYVNSGMLKSNAISTEEVVGENITAYLNANFDIPVRSTVKIETRTSTASDISNDSAWTGWQEATLDQYGYKVNSGLNKFIQYRVTLSTQENDKSPGIYALNDFAIKLSFTKTDHQTKDSATYEAEPELTQPDLPAIEDNPANRIAKVTTTDGVLVQDISSLTRPQVAYTPEELSKFTNNIHSGMLKDDEPIITKFAIGERGSMKAEYIQKKDGTIEHYDADGKVRFITDLDGRILVRKYYDENGNIKDVRMWAERNILNHEIIAAENKIMRKKIEDLQKLAEQVNAIHDNLDKQVKEIQDEIDRARSMIESVRYITYETQTQSFMGSGKMTVLVENPYYAEMIAKLDLAERKFHDNVSLEYFKLTNMENISKGRIEAAAMSVLANLRRQRDVSMVQILRKELSSVIFEYYLKYLGRLPGSQELNDLIEQLAQKSSILQETYTLDIQALRTDLESRPERKNRVTEIDRIVKGVKLELDKYFVSDTEEANLIKRLGLEGEERVNLSMEDKQAVYKYLEYNQANTMHFGQSAFLALKGLIDDYYIAHPELANAGESSADRYVRLAVAVILIDILTGVLNPFTKGDLELSLFAMARAAQLDGLDLNAYKLEWKDLVARVTDYNISAKEKVIVHMNSNHYVVVTSIDAEGNITYFEPNMGENGESVTVSKEEFLNIWKGYSLSARAPPEPARKLTSLEAQKIKGSNIFLIISLVLSIISFGLSFIDNEFCQILSKVLAVAAIITAGIGILQSLPAIFNSFTGAISAFKDVFTAAFKGVGDMLAGTFHSFLGMFTLPNLGMAIANTLISIPMSITMTRGFEFMGLDTRFARIAGSFLSGGISLGAGNALSFSVGGALQALTIQSVTELGDVFGVDPNITSIVSVAAGSLMRAGYEGFTIGVNGVKGIAGAAAAIGKELGTTIALKVASEFAYYGIQTLGEYLGIDPRISYLAGIGIRSSLQAGLSSNMDPGKMWQSVTTGLLQGVTSIGMNYATQELGLNPLLANLGFSLISTAINAGLQVSLGKEKDYFKAIYNTFEKNALTFFGASNDYTQQAAYRAQILDFTKIVMRDGLVAALNTYATGYFNAIAVNAILESGQTIGEYFDNKLKTNQYRIEARDGKQYAAVDILDQQGNKEGAGFFEWLLDEYGTGYWNPIGKEEALGDGIHRSWGNLGVDASNKFGYTDAELYNIFNSDIQFQRIRDGQQVYAEIKDSQGKTLLVIEPTADGHYNVYDSMGEYVKAKIDNRVNQMKFEFENSELGNIIFDRNVFGGESAPIITMSSGTLNTLLFSDVADGKIVIDKLVKSSTWDWLVSTAEAAEDSSSNLSNISNLAIDKINRGETIELSDLASQNSWQSIFDSSQLFAGWANMAMVLFTDSISPTLSPGVKMLMSAFGNETLREELKNQASSTLGAYNLYNQLAAVALGNPGSGTILQQIGLKSFWEGIKSMSQLILDNKASIIYNATELTKLMTNPSAYLTNAFWESDIGKEFINQRHEFFGLTPSQVNTSYDEITQTAKIDPVLNYWNIWEQPVWAVVDTISLFQWGNLSWDRMRKAAVSYYETAVLNHSSMKGTSISGVNTDGVKLDRLTKELTPNSPYTFTITSSFGSEVLSRSNITTEKVIITDTQTKRVNLENWIDDMQLSQDQVLVVDVAGDLPYRPEDLLGLEISDIMNLAMPANILSDNVYDAVTDKAYFNYSQNPNNKYIYMQIISGPGVSLVNPFSSHGVAVNGALDPNAKYIVSVNGVVLEGEHALQELYEKFLRGEDLQ